MGNGESSQYDEDQVRAMLQQGILRDDTLFWKEGMEEWQPLRVLFPQPAKVEPVPLSISHQISAPTYSFTKNPFGLTRALQVMLWVQLGVVVISILSDFGQLSLAVSGNITLEAAEANDARQGMIGLLYLGVFIATGIIFLTWTYQANLNCHGFGGNDMKFTPAWSIGYYFIPFLNLVRPYQAMKEIWKVSSDPKNWQAQQGSAVLRWWWALWLISGFLGQMSFRLMMRVDSPSSLKVATLVSIISSSVEILLILLAVLLVTRIIEKQSKLTKSNG